MPRQSDGRPDGSHNIQLILSHQKKSPDLGFLAHNIGQSKVNLFMCNFCCTLSKVGYFYVPWVQGKVEEVFKRFHDDETSYRIFCVFKRFHNEGND